MDMTNQDYGKLVNQYSQSSPLGKNMVWAFLVGGAICTAGQGLSNLYQNWGMDQDAAGGAVSITLILAAALLTGLGWFDKLAKRAGAGTLLRFRRRKERYLPPQYGGPSPLGGLAAPELTGNDLRWKLCFDRMLAANAALYEELLGGLSLDGCPPRYGVPVILTAGERDWTTPYPLAAAYYDTLSAPCKVFLSLPDAGHLPFRERPEEWSHILLDALAQI